MTLAYVLNTYPQPSHSFIRRELRALEAQGDTIFRLAMRRPTMPLVDPLDHEEEAQTTYVLEQGAAVLAAAVARQAWRRPVACCRALKCALKIGKPSAAGPLRHLIYFAESCYVAEQCAQAGITHLHAHFGTNAAAVAMLVNILDGPAYSFTVHGPEEFDAPMALSLGEKIEHAAFAVAISQFGRSQLCRWTTPDNWSRLKVVHCGIDVAMFPVPGPIVDGPLRLVSIGRFSEQKGQITLISAMQDVIRHRPDATLTLVGDGELRNLIEAEVRRLGLAENIRLTGWLSEADVRAELTQAQALVMPSFAEGLPMVIMEALASGRPVISTYVAGIPELVRPGENGWLVPAGDTQALTDAILDMAKRPASELTKMGTAGRKRALMRHNVDEQAAKLASYINHHS